MNNIHLKAMIFNIQRYCLHDGPGIRTTVFFKGCPLRCLWCCNPESFDEKTEIVFSKIKCIACSRCLQVCKRKAINPNIKDTDGYKIDPALCNVCGDCVAVCQTGALELVGQAMRVDDVYEKIALDVPFFNRSNGGVTFSGGEPLLQIDFLQKILEKCKRKKINTAIETCGYVRWENFEKILKHTDHILYDIKHMDSKTHKELTGVPNDMILANLERVAQANVNLIVRVPLIPGYTDDEKNLQAIGKFVRPLAVNEINLLPYHRMGKNKYKHANQAYQLAKLKDMATTDTGKQVIKKCKRILESYDLKISVGGN